MSTKEAGLRKGLGDWAKVKDAAMAGGLDSSIDLPGGSMFNSQDQSGILDFLAHQMRLEPRAQEAHIIDKLNAQIDALMVRSYGDVDQAVSQFFEKVESLSKVDPMELERTILAVQKVIFLATDTVATLYQDAYLADRVQQDEYWAAYKNLEKEGKSTIGDRQAHAYEKSRDARFYYYYSFLLWRRVSEKLGALRDLQKTLEWFRSRTIKDKPW